MPGVSRWWHGRYTALEGEPLFLTVPTFVLGAVAAGLVSARAPIRSGASVLVAAIALLLLAWPTPNPLVLGGVAVAGAALAVLIGVTARRWGGAMALNSTVGR